MEIGRLKTGFSLVEILLALLVVSMASINIVVLQQTVSAQNRDNFIHHAALKLATKKMEEVLQYELVADITALDDSQEIVIQGQPQTEFTLEWNVAIPDSHYDAGADMRDVQLQVTWQDSQQAEQTFTYSEQVNLAQLLNFDSSVSEEAAIVESFIESNDVIYFEPKMGYKKGAFVIYNSELFEATGPHSVGNGHPRDNDNPTIVSEGWKSYGLIDNPALAENEDLQTLFAD